MCKDYIQEWKTQTAMELVAMPSKNQLKRKKTIKKTTYVVFLIYLLKE